MMTSVLDSGHLRGCFPASEGHGQRPACSGAGPGPALAAWGSPGSAGDALGLGATWHDADAADAL